MKRPLGYLILMLVVYYGFANGQNDNITNFISSRQIDTQYLSAIIKNDGRLYAPGLMSTGIQFSPLRPFLSIFDHGVFVIGYRDGELVGHWYDIDLFAGDDYPYFCEEHGFGYVFSPSQIADRISTAAAYVQLQGPLQPAPGEVGVAFGETRPDHRNAPITAHWGIIDDSYKRKEIGSLPEDLQQLYYYVTGRRLDGTPLINPVTGDTTSFTFTGDPVEHTGWSHTDAGGCGGINASGPITLAPGDSMEIVYALIFASAETPQLAWNDLLVTYWQIRDFYLMGKEIPEPAPEIPDYFRLYPNYLRKDIYNVRHPG